MKVTEGEAVAKPGAKLEVVGLQAGNEGTGGWGVCLKMNGWIIFRSVGPASKITKHERGFAIAEAYNWFIGHRKDLIEALKLAKVHIERRRDDLKTKLLLSQDESARKDKEEILALIMADLAKVEAVLAIEEKRSRATT